MAEFSGYAGVLCSSICQLVRGMPGSSLDERVAWAEKGLGKCSVVWRPQACIARPACFCCQHGMGAVIAGSACAWHSSAAGAANACRMAC